MSQPSDGVRRCSIAGALDVIGDRWSILVLRELGFGQHRFSEIQRATGAPRDVLTARLRKLEAHGVLRREAQPASPTRSQYVMTDAGRALAPVLLALRQWGDDHVNPDDPPVTIAHCCGATFHPVTHCAACGQPADLDELSVVDGDAVRS